MASVTNLQPGMCLTFELQTKMLPSEYTNVKLLSIATADMARAVEDIDAIHANIISTLPTGTPTSPDEYNFLIVKLIDGNVKAVGIPWIKEPIRVITKTDISVLVKNVSAEDAEGISRALNAFGYSDFDISVR